ncbi:MAG: hypothetical protein KC435_06635 [Thermomicrobiales bacterium]|nr:hypothetical protein [Thermomicrobiales bacterium]
MSEFTQAFAWPGGHRSAVSILIHVPGYGFSEGGTDQEDLLGLDYAPQGVRHLLKMLADVDVQATFAFTAEALVDTPGLVEEVHEAGHEVAASFCSASASIGDLIGTIADDIGEPVHGLVSRLPGFPTSDFDGDWGNDSGLAWQIDGRSGDLPVLQRDPDAALIPISPYLMDTQWLSPVRPLPPSSLLEAWMLALDAHREDGSFMPVIVHPHIIGRPGLLGTLTRFLDDTIARGDIWIAPLRHIAATWHAYASDTEESETW